MIRHVLMFRWKDSFTPDIRAKWLEGLEAMRGQIPGMLSLTHGHDVLHTGKSWDHVLIVDFESLEDLDTYNTHPLHEAIKPYSLPNVEELAYVDFELHPHPAVPVGKV
ncbi:Dabb family protein [Corynebacterium hylobatis]|uniref:Dabb family protein n=1 Tax=Corynebacterium hylobatis TaxID=1859290 RepID=A0A3R9ZZM6_9CORY|nr:Dabb family protein [Corynebacterium hylobatis]RSZ63451.1 Dabb family protein [Corynebacterium hylobatis]